MRALNRVVPYGELVFSYFRLARISRVNAAAASNHACHDLAR
jgi:hypothetical protein